MPVPRPTSTCLATLLLVVGGCAVALDGDVAVGRVVTPGNTQVPLPAGNWTLLANDLSVTGAVTGGGIDNQHSTQAYYARLEGGRITQLVIVRTSEGAPAAFGYLAGATCLRNAPSDYLYYQDVASSTVNAIDCVKVTGNIAFNRLAQGSSALYRAAYEKAQMLGGMPRYAVQVEIAQAHSLRYQDYFCYFFPDQSAAATRSADWRIDDLRPATKRYVDDVVGWAKRFRKAVRLGTEYRL